MAHRYVGWIPFPDDEDPDSDKHYITVLDDFDNEVCHIIHRTVGDEFPLDGTIANQKVDTAELIARLLTENDSPSQNRKEHDMSNYWNETYPGICELLAAFSSDYLGRSMSPEEVGDSLENLRSSSPEEGATDDDTITEWVAEHLGYMA